LIKAKEDSGRPQDLIDAKELRKSDHSFDREAHDG